MGSDGWHWKQRRRLFPEDVLTRALVDTGASGTCIDPKILSTKLQLTPTGQTQVHTPSSGKKPHLADVYDVSLKIYGPTLDQVLEFPVIPVMACDLSAQGIQALIGRDILSKCVLVYNGAVGHFRRGERSGQESGCVHELLIKTREEELLRHLCSIPAG